MPSGNEGPDLPLDMSPVEVKKLERFISLVELAARLGGLGLGSFKKHLARERHVAALDGLPAPVLTRPRYMWLESDIDKWLLSRSTLIEEAAKEKEKKNGEGFPRRGRPTNIERENARALGLTVHAFRCKKAGKIGKTKNEK